MAGPPPSSWGKGMESSGSLLGGGPGKVSCPMLMGDGGACESSPAQLVIHLRLVLPGASSSEVGCFGRSPSAMCLALVG